MKNCGLIQLSYLCFYTTLILSCGINPATSNDVNLNEICARVFFAPRPYPGQDDLYIGCVRGIGLIMRCFDNEFFDPELLHCVEYEATTTTEVETTTSSSTVTETTTQSPTTTSSSTVTETVTQSPTTTSSSTVTETITQSPTTTSSSTVTETITQSPTTTSSSTATETITQSPTTTSSSTVTETITQSPTTTSSSTVTETITQSPTTTSTEPPNPCAGISSGRIPHPTDCTLCQVCFLFQILPVECKCNDGEIFWINECKEGDPETCQPFTFA